MPRGLDRPARLERGGGAAHLLRAAARTARREPSADRRAILGDVIAFDEQRLALYPELRRVSLGAFVAGLVRDLGHDPERVRDGVLAHGTRSAHLGTASVRRMFFFALSDKGVT